MYESTSQASPRFDATCDSGPGASPDLGSDPGYDVDFKGGPELLRGWRDGRKPDPELTVSAWADSHRLLSPRGANEAGRWRTSRTPYLGEIMDALSPSHPAQRVVVMKGAQIGATEAGNNWIGYVIHHAPGPMLAVQPTVELAKRFSQQRVDPLIDESPVLRDKVSPARSRDAGNTQLSKEFPGGILVMTGANSAVGLRSMPVRYLFLDEVDAYPLSADAEGEPVALAEARTRTYSWRRKVFLASTPTVKGLSRIEREFEASDQRRFFLPCPLCGALQWLKFERLRWDWGTPSSVAYVCEACDGSFGEHHKTRMLAAGRWQATATSADPGTIGFHLSALYSPLGWYSWAQIARDWEGCQANDEAKRSFKNTVLGETWFEAGEAPDWQRLYDRREDYHLGTVPAGGLLLTAGADVQKDRIEVSIWAWGRGLESWLVDHLIIDGSPAEPTPWTALSALLGRTWPHACGAELGLARLAIDTGGQYTTEVYAWTRRQSVGQVMAIKGVDGFDRTTPVGGPTNVEARQGGRRSRAGAKLWTIAVAVFKSELYRFLRQERPTDEEIAAGGAWPAGWVHLPQGLDAERVKQLVAEQLVTVKTKRGFDKLEWQKLRARNETLDCRVYARAAAWVLGIDRFAEARWKQLEGQVAAPPGESAERSASPPQPPAAVSRPAPPRRQIAPSSWMME